MKLKDYLLITALTLISPWLFGYYFGVLDHDHYLPYINKILNPQLYSYDYYFSQPHGLYSLFNFVIAGLKTITGLELAWLYLVLYLVSLWLLYLGVYYLAYTIYKRAWVGFLAVWLFLLPKWAAQIGYQTHHFYFISRDLSLALSLLALALILQQRRWRSFSLILAAALVNPSIPIPVAIYWFLPYLKLIKTRLAVVWVDILKERGSYSFPALWRWTGWGNLVLFASLLGISWLKLKQKVFGRFYQSLKSFLLICGGMFVFHFLVSLWAPWPALIQLQLLRAINFVFILALIAFANLSCYSYLALLAAVGVFFWGDHLTGWHFLAIWLPGLGLIFSHRPLKIIKGFYLYPVLVLVFFLGYKLILVKPQINLPYYIYYPNALVKVGQWADRLALQQWARDKTPIEAVFLVPPDLTGFRSFSQRAIITDAKDGGLVFYSPDYARQWKTRMNDLAGWANFSSQQFLDLQTKYQFNYLVVYQSHPALDFPVVFQNSSFSVYQL